MEIKLLELTQFASPIGCKSIFSSLAPATSILIIIKKSMYSQYYIYAHQLHIESHIRYTIKLMLTSNFRNHFSSPAISELNITIYYPRYRCSEPVLSATSTSPSFRKYIFSPVSTEQEMATSSKTFVEKLLLLGINLCPGEGEYNFYM